MQYREFVGSAEARARYWARSLIGWPRFVSAQPGAGHRAVAELERLGVVTGLITQNVDRLHHAAGSEQVIELHGALAEVRCLSCGALTARSAHQEALLRANPGWSERLAPFHHADGDAELTGTEGFRVVDCARCHGVLKPNVVFFGENVPRPVTEAAWATLEAGEVLLVIGSSLTVFSGFRFVRRAAEKRLPIAIVNLGETRGDPLATLRIEGRIGEVLPRLVEAFRAPPPTQAVPSL